MSNRARSAEAACRIQRATAIINYPTIAFNRVKMCAAVVHQQQHVADRDEGVSGVQTRPSHQTMTEVFAGGLPW
jgi:hypothetical protein